MQCIEIRRFRYAYPDMSSMRRTHALRRISVAHAPQKRRNGETFRAVRPRAAFTNA